MRAIKDERQSAAAQREIMGQVQEKMQLQVWFVVADLFHSHVDQ